jgi:spermidine/putrescine transport system permease protein
MRLSISALLGKIEMSRGTAGRLQKGAAAAVLLFLYLPIAIVVLFSFTPEQSPTFPMPGLSLRWYEALIEDQAFLNAIVFSSKLAVVSALGSGFIGLLAAFGLVRGDFGDTWLTEDLLRILFSLPIIIPFIITGIGGLVFFNFVGIYGDFSSLVVGHIMIILPFTSLVIASGLDGLDESLEEAARNLGATQLRSYVEVTIPMIMPSIIAALLFAFILSFNNFIQTFFWLSFTDQTLPVLIYGLVTRTYDPTLNAVGTVLIVLSLLITVTAERISSRILT